MTARLPKITMRIVYSAWLSKARFFIRMACQLYQSGPPKAVRPFIRSTAMLRNIKVLLFAFVVLAVAGSAYAFAAQNTVPDSAAGYKGTTVPGYTVTNLVYDLDATDPKTVDAITFDIAPSSGSSEAVVVKVQTQSGGTWTDCSLAAGTPPSQSATCTFGALLLEDVTELNIVASSTTDP